MTYHNGKLMVRAAEVPDGSVRYERDSLRMFRRKFARWCTRRGIDYRSECIRGVNADNWKG